MILASYMYGVIYADGKPPVPLTVDVPKYKALRNKPCPCGSGRKYKKCCVNETRKVPLL